MDDERTLREVDARLSQALRPGHESVRRVVEEALAEPVSHHDGRLFSCAVAAAIAITAAVGGWAWQHAAVVRPSLSVVGRGSVVVVDSSEGRRWMLGPKTSHVSGNYVIVLPQ
jgi:hypothetical protein